MKFKAVLKMISVLVFGIAIGFAISGVIKKKNDSEHKVVFVQKREGVSEFINPLLACDVAEDVLSDPEIETFKNEVEKYININIGNHSVDKVSVYFRELNDGLFFSIGDNEKYTPASLRKVPLMIAFLKQAENEKNLLDKQVRYDLSTDENIKQNFKPSHALVSGNLYTIRDLIYRMIVYSDNNAFTYLTKIVNPNELRTVYSKLRILDNPDGTSDDFRSVQTYESFFRILYNASYLNHDASNWALNILSDSEFKSGLVAGVPPSVKVAHKFGEHSDSSSTPAQLHDCGIVYYPKHPYLLCVMSEGSNFKLLEDVIAGVSQTIFTEVDVQSRNKTSKTP